MPCSRKASTPSREVQGPVGKFDAGADAFGFDLDPPSLNRPGGGFGLVVARQWLDEQYGVDRNRGGAMPWCVVYLVEVMLITYLVFLLLASDSDIRKPAR